MKTSTLVIVLCMLSIVPLACSSEEAQRLATQSPELAPATQLVERVQQRVDPIAQQAEDASRAIRGVAEGAASLGIPYSGVIVMVATAIATLAGAYNERRRGTMPFRAALTQVVQSVEAAFPEKSDHQKTAMSSVQDVATKKLVSEIKAS